MAIGCSDWLSIAAAQASTSSACMSASGMTFGDAEPAFGQRAGLVEDHRVEVAGPLEARAVADQESARRAEAGADRHHQRHREAEGVRAGDHQHRDGAGDGELEGRPHRKPDDQASPSRSRARCRSGCSRRGRRGSGCASGTPAPVAPSRSPARDRSRSRSCGSRCVIAPSPLTAPPITSSPSPRSTGFDSPVSIDFVEAGAAVDDDPVGRYLGAGADEHAVAGLELGDLHLLGAAVGLQPVAPWPASA